MPQRGGLDCAAAVVVVIDAISGGGSGSDVPNVDKSNGSLVVWRQRVLGM